MSGSLNKVMLIGNLGDDIKMHHFEDGGCVGRFPLATNESYISKQTGEKVSNTEWHNVVVRNKAAEICNKYLKKVSEPLSIYEDQEKILHYQNKNYSESNVSF